MKISSHMQLEKESETNIFNNFPQVILMDDAICKIAAP